MALIYEIDSETLAKFQHQMIVGLSQISLALTMVADDVESGAIPPPMVGTTVREFAQLMTNMVADISD